MNDEFKIEALTVHLRKDRPGINELSPSMFPKFIRKRVTFTSKAPAWLINGIRGVVFAYVKTKRLKIIPESYSCNNRGVMQEFITESVGQIMCHQNTPVNAKYTYSVQSDKSSITMLQAASFNAVIDSNAIRDAFEGSSMIGYLNVSSKISFEAIVVEEPAYKSPIKPIEKKFVFYPAKALEMFHATDDPDEIFEDRVNIDSPPYIVSFISHGYGPVFAPFQDAIEIIVSKLTEWKSTLASSISKSGYGVKANGEHDKTVVEHSWKVDEPLDHISSLVRGVLQRPELAKKYRSVIMQHNHITVTTLFRIVYAGELSDLIADLATRIDETIAEVRKFNTPSE